MYLSQFDAKYRKSKRISYFGASEYHQISNGIMTCNLFPVLSRKYYSYCEYHQHGSSPLQSLISGLCLFPFLVHYKPRSRAVEMEISFSGYRPFWLSGCYTLFNLECTSCSKLSFIIPSRQSTRCAWSLRCFLPLIPQVQGQAFYESVTFLFDVVLVAVDESMASSEIVLAWIFTQTQRQRQVDNLQR